MTRREWYVHACVVDGPEGERQVLTLLPPEDVLQTGIAPEAVVGTLIDPKKGIRPDNFAANPLFRELLQRVVREHAPSAPELRDVARRQVDGWVIVFDLRTPNPAEVPPEDIVGMFRVENGRVVPDSYQGSPNHRLFTEHGFFRLDPWIESKLHEAVRSLGDRSA